MIRKVRRDTKFQRTFLILDGKIVFLHKHFNSSRMEQLTIPFFCPEIEKAGTRRRPRTVPVSDASITSRRERLEKRNRLITARYYYWTEIKRRRFDDVLKILSDNEFFVEERTISNTLIEQDEFYHELINSRASSRRLKAMFPGFDWN